MHLQPMLQSRRSNWPICACGGSGDDGGGDGDDGGESFYLCLD